MTGALYAQVAFTIERYLVVCHPFYIVSKEWSVRRYIIPLVSFSILYNLPKFFELDTFVCENSLKHEEHIKSDDLPLHNVNDSFYTPTTMRKSEHYKRIYLTGMNIIFMGIGPFLILIILNGLTLINLKKYQKTKRRVSVMPVNGLASATAPTGCHNNLGSGSKSREVTLAKISLAIVFTSILFHSVKWVPTIHEFVDVKGYLASSWILSFEHVSHFLLVFNSSINYYIYAFTRSKIGNKLQTWTRNSFKLMKKPTDEMSPKARKYSTPIKGLDHQTELSKQDTMITEPMLSSIDERGNRWQ